MAPRRRRARLPETLAQARAQVAAQERIVTMAQSSAARAAARDRLETTLLPALAQWTPQPPAPPPPVVVPVAPRHADAVYETVWDGAIGRRGISISSIGREDA